MVEKLKPTLDGNAYLIKTINQLIDENSANVAAIAELNKTLKQLQKDIKDLNTALRNRF